MRNDIIELFTDIDDELISGAMPEAQKPVELRVDTRRFSWKKFAAAAACLTAAAVGGTFALKALSGNGGIEYGPGSVDSELTSSVDSEPTSSIDSELTSSIDSEPTSSIDSEPTSSVNSEPTSSIDSEPTSSVDSEPTSSGDSEPTSNVVSEPTFAEYPEEAKYQYTGDFSELEPFNYAVVGRIAYLSLDDLATNSDLVVMGTFVDDAWQNCPVSSNETSTDKVDGNDDVMDLYLDGASYNKLRIDKVFCGDIAVGSEIVIRDDTFVYNGMLMNIASDTLTPMIKGEQWVYFLRKQSPENGDYYFPQFTEGRYPVPGNENTFVLTGSQHGVFDEKYFHEDIYEDVKKMLGYVDGIETVDYLLEVDKKVFTMPEFPGDEFIWTKNYIWVCHKRIKYTHDIFTAPGIVSVYLTDLNGDGKREIVTLRRDSDSGFTSDNLMVYDHANSMFYIPKTDKTMQFHHDLVIKDNVLNVLTYRMSSYTVGHDIEAFSNEPLTFDILEPITRSDSFDLDCCN